MKREQAEAREAELRRQREWQAKLVEHAREILDDLMVLYGQLLTAKDTLGRSISRVLFLAKSEEINQLEMPLRMRHDVNAASFERLRLAELLLL